MNVNRALQSDRLMKGVTGMSVSGFQELAKEFEEELEKEKQLRYDEDLKKCKRERLPGGGRKGNLKTMFDKCLINYFLFCSISNAILPLM